MHLRAREHKFDLTGEEEGYIAILLFEDLQKAKKIDTGLIYKIYEMCGRKCMEMLNQQYLGFNVTDPIEHNMATLSKKEIFKLFDNV